MPSPGQLTLTNLYPKRTQLSLTQILMLRRGGVWIEFVDYKSLTVTCVRLCNADPNLQQLSREQYLEPIMTLTIARTHDDTFLKPNPNP